MATVAYPSFEKRSYQISHGEITLNSTESGSAHRFSTVLMEGIGSIAVMNLDNRLTRIKAKAIARATAKYAATSVAAKIAEDQGGFLIGLAAKIAGNIAAVATESADIRHWRLLPAEIRVGKIVVPPGEYEGRIEFVDASGTVVYSTGIQRFAVGEAEKRFITYRTLR